MEYRESIKIAIIDYQMSNLFSVLQACKYCGADANLTTDKKDILDADAVILPGVGAFGKAMENLNNLNLISVIKEIITHGKPFMGICLGLQLLFSESEEFGKQKGLDIIPGGVVRFSTINSATKKKIKVPQIGWNSINDGEKTIATWEDSPLKIISRGEFMYFVHSYYVVPDDIETILSITDYEGINYCSSIIKGNLFAVQFHPEKSGKEGLKIYQNWIDRIKKGDF